MYTDIIMFDIYNYSVILISEYVTVPSFDTDLPFRVTVKVRLPSGYWRDDVVTTSLPRIRWIKCYPLTCALYL